MPATKARRKKVLSLAAVTSTGAGSSIDFGPAPVRNVVYYLKQASVTTGGTIKIQVSHDGTLWYDWQSITANADGDTAALVTNATAAENALPRYWRGNLSARTDGTFTLYIEGVFDP